MHHRENTTLEHEAAFGSPQIKTKELCWQEFRNDGSSTVKQFVETDPSGKHLDIFSCRSLKIISIIKISA